MGRFSSYSRANTYYTGHGRWRRPVEIIYKTHAMKEYGLSDGDLGELSPLSAEVNPRNSRQRVVVYNEAKVRALAFRVQQRKEVMRSKGLSPADLDRLTPVRTAPNPHANATGPTRFYKRSDVEALVKEIRRETATAREAIAQDVAVCKAKADDEELWAAFDADDGVFALV
ncbi:hypothetical protein MIND_01080100 [Mycena indigotica]|uniref:Uncharacterized protein n=1 Tax=Mycena indigotica TaxID=2126181 RepID=A0A8H6SCL7_9AGAR|nr:uncharacterized protein MIND_01080100 [Mycena indigotica]KAF7295405.1 hypothetical protein MIND_01080100 [Mycena indigotica]